MTQQDPAGTPPPSGPAGRRQARVDALRRAVFGSPGASSAATRIAAADGRGLPEPLAGYAATVARASYRITDADITALRAAGCGEDEIFEVTVASALGAALRGLDAGLRAMRERPGDAAGNT